MTVKILTWSNCEDTQEAFGNTGQKKGERNYIGGAS